MAVSLYQSCAEPRRRSVLSCRVAGRLSRRVACLSSPPRRSCLRVACVGEVKAIRRGRRRHNAEQWLESAIVRKLLFLGQYSLPSSLPSSLHPYLPSPVPTPQYSLPCPSLPSPPYLSPAALPPAVYLPHIPTLPPPHPSLLCLFPYLSTFLPPSHFYFFPATAPILLCSFSTRIFFFLYPHFIKYLPYLELLCYSPSCQWENKTMQPGVEEGFIRNN